MGTDAHNTHFFCITEGTTDKACDEEKMKDAAECKVAHEAAYNRCFSLWTRAKKNIHAARERAAAPMHHTDEMVKAMDAGSKKCATLVTKADGECKTAFAKYHTACKAKMVEAVEADFTAVQEETLAFIQKAAAAPKKGTGKKIAEKAAADSKADLKAAKKAITKENANPKMAKAIVKCELKKNVARRTCINAVHAARDSCSKLTSFGLEDNDSSEEFEMFLQETA